MTDCATNCPECGRTSPVVNGTYSLIGDVLKVLRHSSVTATDIMALRDIANEVKSGRIGGQQASAKASLINASFASLPVQTSQQENIALWAILLAIIGLCLQLDAARQADISGAQSHRDAKSQLEALGSIPQVQQKIYEQLRRQADASPSQAQVLPEKRTTPTQTQGSDLNRRERRARSSATKKRKR